MLTPKFKHRLDADQAIMESIWLSGFGFFCVLGVEAYAARDRGWEYVSVENLLLSFGFALTGWLIMKRKTKPAMIGLALPVIHFLLDMNLYIGILDILLFYFIWNGVAAIKAYDSLPEGPSEDQA
jgi:hypothetical protein